ncbi:MAG TPA: zinc-binding dehydrogenase [Candidatus Eisenbacteria bacterium]|nr:zinc-binding dehydrogenase [Candidatus Eisenbacteria bacterium]
MKAVFFEKHGGPEVLQYGDFKDPVPGPDEVLVGVSACALNHLDIWVRQGLPGIPIPLPHIPGSDVCGVVLDFGANVSRLKKGDRVLVSPGQVPQFAPEASVDRDSYSAEFRILGLQTQGGYAEKVAVHERFVIPVSGRFSDEQWAALPLAALTAYHMLVTRADLRAGETVLVHAAGSGIGSFAVQLAKFLGATVYTTVGDDRKVEPARKLGADEVIRYKTTDFSEEAKRLTGGRGVDVIFEHIGPQTWPGNLACLARGGRMVTCGATSGPKAEVDLRLLYAKQLSILGCYMGSLAELRAVLALAERGALAPVVDRVFPLREAADAQRHMESRQNFGKIVLKV